MTQRVDDNGVVREASVGVDAPQAPELNSRRGLVYGMAAAGAALVAATARPARAEAAPRGGKPVLTGVVAVNVSDHGAIGDGVTDDSAAIQAAVDEAQTSGRPVYLPAGAYAVSATLAATKVLRLVGDGMWATTILLTGSASWVDQATKAGHLTIEDIGFDAKGIERAVLNLDARAVRTWRVERCRFTNLGGNYAAPAACTINGVDHGEFVDCLWHNPRAFAACGTGVRFLKTGSGRQLTFRGSNTFRWLSNGIRGEAGYHTDTTLDVLDIDGALFDGYWWLLPDQKSGEGATVTYTDKVVTDSRAPFTGLNGTTLNVRAMPVRASGTVTGDASTQLTDGAVDFSGVLRGEIVRSGDRFAVVQAVRGHSLSLEPWLDNTTLLPTDPPAVGTPYTVYGILQFPGKVTSPTTMTTTLWGFRDLHGKYVTPAAGTRYEVQVPYGIYPILTNTGVLNLRVTNSTFRRGWADQIGGFCQRGQIINNLFEDGQDVGCTLQGGQSGHIVIGNHFRHQGSVAVYLNANNSIMMGNRSEGANWNQPVEWSSGFMVWSATNNLIAYNTATYGTESVGPERGKHGVISLRHPGTADDGPATSTTGNVLLHNTADTAADGADVMVYGDKVVGNTIVGSTVALVTDYKGVPAVPQLMELDGTGDPNGAVPATLGSTFRRTDGGAGTSLYVKESGTGSTGWAAK